MRNANVFYSVDNNYNALTDEELISLVKSDDKYALDFIIEKYKDLVNMKVGKYFIIGAEKEDIIQIILEAAKNGDESFSIQLDDDFSEEEIEYIKEEVYRRMR